MKAKKLWCAERVQRLMMSLFLLLILVLLAKGYSTLGLGLLAFMSIMLFIHFIFDFCPSTVILNKIFGSCFCECKDEE
ncbi:phosphoribosylaminoimidazole synthetase [Caminibacter mediatlanticus TB-2]|uniref:Phosphoribosylaminoimidazole synthetase n=1 Tax=Caminibacter mediatlanticus TB-2 TaxID=391592 RepID=A0ABX5V9E2_9BACT|nr:phosphoribosylaminoimidazole synthetase [Caminibacter mediatlanticus]QCT93690.1 phosphoribosylaminoimidazole synthetase [Caminibacter mediatlanticus TB-2]